MIVGSLARMGRERGTPVDREGGGADSCFDAASFLAGCEASFVGSSFFGGGGFLAPDASSAVKFLNAATSSCRE